MPAEEDPEQAWKSAVSSIASLFKSFLGDDTDVSVGFYFASLNLIRRFEEGVDDVATELCIVGDGKTKILFQKDCPSALAGTSQDVDTAGPDFFFSVGEVWAEHASLNSALAHLRARLLNRAQAGDGRGA